MANPEFYLKEDVYFEPLFNNWFVWPMLLPPATASMYMINTHKRIMKSFINNYQLHIIACQESVLTGGEFLDCTEEQIEDIKGLIEEIESNCTDLVQLHEAIKELDEIMRNHTSGKSIEPLYSKVPDALKGYVELFLDMEHRASYRFLEPLLYASKYYKPSLQSISLGMCSKVDDRPFVLSTPRFPDENHIQVNADFNNSMIDALFKSREIPITMEERDALFANKEVKGGFSYAELFTNEPSKYLYEPVTEGVRLQYTGHAGFMVQTPKITILIDPVIAARSDKYADEIIGFSELPPFIDYVCLTHNHQDHVSLETLLQIRYKIGSIIVPKNNGGSLPDPSIRLLLKQLNFNVIEVDDLDEISFTGGKIVSIPFLGEHGDINIRSKAAWLVEADSKKFFFGADSSNPETCMYQHIHDIIGDIDLLCIGMECVGAPYTWLYGALHTKVVSKSIKESRRLNGSDCEQALKMVDIFAPKDVYIYALGMEPWYKYFMGLEYSDESKQILEAKKLIKACDEIGTNAEMMYGKKTIDYPV